MGSQPDHKAAFSALIDACAYTVIDVEKHLDEQKESDAAEVRRQEEEKRQNPYNIGYPVRLTNRYTKSIFI